MQSRLEEEEQAKAALMGRIQRLTKLILVSTKNTIPPAPVPEKTNHRRRHSFGEEEVTCYPRPLRKLVHESLSFLTPLLVDTSFVTILKDE